MANQKETSKKRISPSPEFSAKKLRDLSDDELDIKIRIARATVLDATMGALTIAWVDTLAEVLLNLRLFLEEQERRNRPLNVAQLARKALSELEQGNVIKALEIRNQVIRHENYFTSKLAMPLMIKFNELATNDSIVLMELAVKAAKSKNIPLAQELVQKVLAINPNMVASSNYHELQTLLSTTSTIEVNRVVV